MTAYYYPTFFIDIDMDTQALLQQIQLGEDTSLELKTLTFQGDKITGPHVDGFADELAAMANTAAGSIILGVDDRTKNIVGIPTDKLDLVETWLRSICNDRIKPSLFCHIHKLSVPGGNGNDAVIIRIDIPRSLFVHQSPGGYFHRIGSSKRQMSPDFLARMFQQRSQTRLIRFDEQTLFAATKSSLVKEYWQKFRTPLSPPELVTDEDFLQKLQLLAADEGGQLRPTVSGVLMACPQPHEFLPDAFIQAVAYRGSERNATGQIDAMDITGTLDEQIAEACHFVKKNMRIGATKAPGRIDIPQYSMQAVFEAVVNAVAHRDYSIYGSKIRLHMFSDRLELYSPGSIPNTLTIESLVLRQSSRNELLTSLLARCPVTIKGNRIYGSELRGGIMDKRGEGVPIIFSECEKLSGRKPIYRLIDDAELLLTMFPSFAIDGYCDLTQ